MPTGSKSDAIPRLKRFPPNSWTCADLAYAFIHSEGEEKEYFREIFLLRCPAKRTCGAKAEPTSSVVELLPQDSICEKATC